MFSSDFMHVSAAPGVRREDGETESPTVRFGDQETGGARGKRQAGREGGGRESLPPAQDGRANLYSTVDRSLDGPCARHGTHTRTRKEEEEVICLRVVIT